MEEADALADRAGIMAKRMLAIGSTDHLRKKHGHLLYVHLVMGSAPHTSDEEIASVRTWIENALPDADLDAKSFHGQIRFALPVQQTMEKRELNNGGSLMGDLIRLLEINRERLGLEHYSVSPTSLDQVFLAIVGKHDIEEENYNRGRTRKRRSVRPPWKRRR